LAIGPQKAYFSYNHLPSENKKPQTKAFAVIKVNKENQTKFEKSPPKVKMGS